LCQLVYSARSFGKATQNVYLSASLTSEARTCMALELMAAKSLAILVAPIMPTFAKKLWQGLGYPKNSIEDRSAIQLSWLPAGMKCFRISQNYFTKPVLQEEKTHE
jgi:methionyl-tRNA synthetase